MICPSRAAVGAMFIVLIGVHCAGRYWIFNTLPPPLDRFPLFCILHNTPNIYPILLIMHFDPYIFDKYALSNQIDIILFQEPSNRDHKAISHPSFKCIMPKIAIYSSIVAIFVTKSNPKLQCTPRTDLIHDSDMQIIEITIDEVRKVQIFNIYNEKSQSNRETYTIDRLLIKYQPTSTDQFVICGDFNAYHNW